MLTVNQVAQRLGFHPQSVRDLVRVGKLPGKKVNFKWSFDETEINDLIRKSQRSGNTVSQVYLAMKVIKN